MGSRGAFVRGGTAIVRVRSGQPLRRGSSRSRSGCARTVGLPRDADELTVRVALDHYLGFADEMLTDARWGTLEVVAGTEGRLLGAHGPHHARLRAQPFEVLRSVCGRRSARQIRALDWDGDVDDLLALLEKSLTGGYSLPQLDLIEGQSPESQPAPRCLTVPAIRATPGARYWARGMGHPHERSVWPELSQYHARATQTNWRPPILTGQSVRLEGPRQMRLPLGCSARGL